MKIRYSTFELWKIAASAALQQGYGISLADAGADDEELRQYYADHTRGWEYGADEVTVLDFAVHYANNRDLDTPDLWTAKTLKEKYAIPEGDVHALYPETYTGFQVEAALCVYEFLRDQGEFDGYFENLGTGQMRLTSTAIGVYVDAVYRRYEELHGEMTKQFDWEFVPAVIWSFAPRIDEVIAATAYSDRGYWPEIDAIVAEVVERLSW